MLIFGTHLIHEPAIEFFLYAFLMFVVVCVFIAIAINYTYVNEHYMAKAAAEEDKAEIEAEKAAAVEASNSEIAAFASPSALHKRVVTNTNDSKC